MKLLIEDYHYDPTDLPELKGIDPTKLSGGQIKLLCVGYYHDGGADETIFILPKVFIIGGKAFGRYEPEHLLCMTEESEQLTETDHAFLFELSAWIYQAIALFCERHPENEITSHR